MNLIDSQAGVDGGSGASTAKTLRVILSTDSPGGSSSGGGWVAKTIDANKTRPNDGTAYAAGDVVAESTSAATVWTFTACASGNGKGGTIVSAVMIESVAQATKPDLELWLFDTTITTQNDNVAWAPTDSDMEKCVGVIDLPAALYKTASGNGVIDRQGLNLQFNAAASDTNLYGVLVVRNAYTPVALEKIVIRLKIAREA